MRDAVSSFRELPSAVKGLLIANTAVFLFALVPPVAGALWGVFGLVPGRVTGQFWVWQLFTYMFLHAGFLHFFFNMLVLWSLGRFLEGEWGTAGFLKFYFTCGMGAGLFSVAFTPHSMNVTVGASGAIYGLLAAFAMLYPNSVLYLYFIIPLRARVAVLVMGGFTLYASLAGQNDRVANLAHLGGLLWGYAYLKWGVWRWKLTGFWGRLSDWRPRRAAKPRGPALHELSEEVDRILDKILKEGVTSLTAEEQELMRRYSKMKK